VALGLAAGGCAGPARPEAIVLVSGRDDHGLLEKPAVALQRSPTDLTVTGSVADGGFAHVLREDHSWLYVRSIAEPREEGWVNDHDLRAVAVLTTRNVQVVFVDAAVRDGAVMVLVRERQESPDRAVWVPAKALREVGAR
jgi:hypothetical protein